MLSFSLVAEALTGVIYHRPSGENSNFQFRLFITLDHFMGTNILFWNCQGIRPKHKELELYLKENVIDVNALNETFLSKKHNFKIPGYDTIRNDRSTGLKGGVAFLVKKPA